MTDSWGNLGKPPAWFNEAPRRYVEEYKKLLEEERRVMKMTGRVRVVRMQELKAKFRRLFPDQKPDFNKGE